MPRPRTPTARARVEARHIKNPQRFRGRNDPSADALGDPPSWLTDAQAAAWHDFVSELPWLVASHRALLEIACVLRARLKSGQEIGTKALSLLRLTLGSLGATPVDASKVAWASEEEPDDLLD